MPPLPRATPCLVLSAILFAACALAGDRTPPVQSGNASPAPSARDFAYAMQRLEPLALVEGGGDVTPCRTSGAGAEHYAEAMAYAESMGSYSLLIWRDGQCQLEAYFSPFDRDTRPESASMHKSVVGILIAAAIADGHIEGPDARIGDYIPEWSHDPRGEITIRQLLTMSSGLRPLSRDGGAASEAMRFITGSEDIRALVLGSHLDSTPGSVFHYSGVNTQLLLMILESATGEKYVDYASVRLWQPLDAADAYVWRYTGKSPMPRAHMSLLAPARDWLKLGLLIKDYGRYGGRQLVPRALMEAATQSSSANPDYGWQLWLGRRYQPQRFYNEQKTGSHVPMSEPFAVEDMVFFDGFGGQRVYLSRERDLVIVRQGDMRTDWDDARLPNLIIRADEE